MIADDMVTEIYKHGDPELAAELGRAVVVSVPFSMLGADDRLSALIPRDSNGDLVAPWARPPYPAVLLISDPGCMTWVKAHPTEKIGELKLSDPPIWAVDAVLIAISGGAPVPLFACVICGMANGRVARLSIGDPAGADATFTSLRNLARRCSGRYGEAALERYIGDLCRELGGGEVHREQGYAGQLKSVVGTAFALMNCRNITTRDEISSRQQRRSAERSGRTLFTVKTLVVKPVARRSGAVGDPRGQPLALHWVRGHFKHYTPEKPLFGSATGTYWWSPHLSGDVNAGAVVKDYAVRSGAHGASLGGESPAATYIKMVPEVGIEPTQSEAPRDFEPSAGKPGTRDSAGLRN